MTPEEKIRQRKSYKFWKGIYETIADPHLNDTQKTEYVFDAMSGKKLFGSNSNENYSRESLNLLTEDKENE